MPHISLTINDEVVMHGDLGGWSSEPAAITELKANAATQPWAIPVMQAIATAAIHQQDTVIVVATRDDGWSIDVSTE